jgi:hypothetical protein
MRQIVLVPPANEGCAHESRKLPALVTFGESPPVEIVITAVWLLVPKVPVMITHPVTVLAVVKLKFVLAEPLPMVTFGGTVSAGLLLVKATVETPILAPVKDAVQFPEPPGETVEGVQLRLESDTGSDKEIEMVCEVPLNVAVKVAVEGTENVPACARNEPEDRPLDTVIGALGTVSAALLLDTKIDAVLPAGTGFVRLTVQLVEVCACRAPAAHINEDTPTGTVREIVAVAVLSFNVPVKVAVWFEVTAPVETLNVPDVAPAASVTDAGAVNAGDALFVNVATAPPGSAPSDRVTVHVVLAFEESVVALQFSAVIVGGGSSDMVAVAPGPFRAPVKVAVWSVVTAPVEMVNAAVVAPAATVTEAGALKTADALLVRVTTAPPGSAAFDSVTVHVRLPFEESVVNVHASPLTVGGVSSDMFSLAVDPLRVAVRVAVWFAATAPVEILNVSDTVPAATVTDAGTANTADAVFVSVTTAPPGDAALDSVTVHAVPPFEDRAVSVHARPRIVGSGCSEMVAVAVVPFKAAVSVAVEYAVSMPVETLNVPVVAPADTVTEVGAVNTADALLVKVTTAPPGSAAFDSVTVHVVPPFDDNAVKVHESPLTVGGTSSEMLAVAVVPFRAAVNVAVWFAVNVPVATLNVPVVIPAATVTDAGADNTGEALFVNATTAPPVSAPSDRVTVHVLLAFDDNTVALQFKPVAAGSGWSDTVAVAVEPFSVAVNVAVWFAVTVPVEMLSVPATVPAETVTDAGADNTGDALFVNATTAPPVAAARDNVTVQVVLLLEDKVVSVHESPSIVGRGCRDIVAVDVEPLRVAVNVAVWFAVTVPVEMLNVPVVAPATTVTVAGAARTGEALFVSVTTVPPAGAASDRVTVQVVLAFEDSVVAVQLNPAMAASGCRDSVVVAVVPFSVAVKVAVWFAGTVPVEMLNVPVVASAATVSDGGAVNTDDPLFVSVTTAPPVSAALDNVAVHVVLAFEDNVAAVQLNPVRPGSGCNDTFAVAVVPFSAAVKVAVWFADTVPVEMLKVPVAAPAATVSDAGAVNIGDPLFVSVTTAPPVSTALDNVAVHVVLAFEDNIAAVQLNPVTPGSGCNNTFAVAVDPFSVAVRVAVWFAVTVPVEMLNVPATVPADTVTDAGAVNTGEALFVKATTAPPVSAALESVTVHDVPLLEDRAVKVQPIPRTVGSDWRDIVAVAVPFSVAVNVAF